MVEAELGLAEDMREERRKFGGDGREVALAGCGARGSRDSAAAPLALAGGPRLSGLAAAPERRQPLDPFEDIAPAHIPPASAPGPTLRHFRADRIRPACCPSVSPASPASKSPRAFGSRQNEARLGEVA